MIRDLALSSGFVCSGMFCFMLVRGGIIARLYWRHEDEKPRMKKNIFFFFTSSMKEDVQ